MRQLPEFENMSKLWWLFCLFSHEKRHYIISMCQIGQNLGFLS